MKHASKVNQSFRYFKADYSSVARTFARVRRELAEQKKAEEAAKAEQQDASVTPIRKEKRA